MGRLAFSLAFSQRALAGHLRHGRERGRFSAPASLWRGTCGVLVGWGGGERAGRRGFWAGNAVAQTISHPSRANGRALAQADFPRTGQKGLDSADGRESLGRWGHVDGVRPEGSTVVISRHHLPSQDVATLRQSCPGSWIPLAVEGAGRRASKGPSEPLGLSSVSAIATALFSKSWLLSRALGGLGLRRWPLVRRYWVRAHAVLVQYAWPDLPSGCAVGVFPRSPLIPYQARTWLRGSGGGGILALSSLFGSAA